MPGNIGLQIGNATIVRPSVVTEINTSAMVPAWTGTSDIAGVIGYADGGVPNTVMTFTSYAAAAATLRGGTILSYLSRIFNPSPDAPGASTAYVIRCGSPTQATGTVGGVSWTSTDYGLHTNGISVQVAVAVANASYWDVTIRKRADGYSKVYTVGAGLTATSTATTPKIQFDHVNKVCSLLENAVVVATFAYPSDGVNISALAAWVATRPNWTCTLASGADPSMPVRYMDNPGTPLTIATTATLVPANQGMLVYEINLLDPVIDAGVLPTYTTLSVVAETYLSGGTGNSTATATLSDYTTALTAMDSVDPAALFVCDVVGVGAATGAVGAYQNCVNNRTITRKRYRILYTGAAPGQTATTAATIPATLPGPVVYAWNGVAGLNPVSGIVEQLGGLGTAALLCGLACGSAPGNPITGASVYSYGLEYPNPQDSDIDSLLRAGVSPVVVNPATGKTYLVQGLTTWQGGSNVSWRILQGLRVQDALSRLFNSVLAQFIGYPLDLMTGQIIKAAAAKALDGAVVSPQNPDGYLTPGFTNGKATPAWTNLTVTTDGLQSWSINVAAHPVCETDYIHVVVNLSPVAISL